MSKSQNTPQNREKVAMRVSTYTILCNVLLFLLKLLAGLIGRSAAMISDAVHTLSDVLSTVIVMIGVKTAGKSADKDHPYGHERFECVAAIILAILLCATGLGIGWGGIRSILASEQTPLATPGLIALIAALISIVVKEGMYWYTRAAAKRIHSGALMADAWHHRSDALSSIGSFAAILGARMGLPLLDPLACVLICLLILKASYDVFMDAIGKMTDKACDAETEATITALILAQQGVLGLDLLHTRLFGERIYIDAEVIADGTLSLHDAHEIAHCVHDAIEDAIPAVKHCMVHVNPQLPPIVAGANSIAAEGADPCTANDESPATAET